MRNIRRRTAAVATLATLALALTACSSGGGDDDKGSDGSSGTASIDDAHSKGAMADFKAGSTFKASEPVEFSMLYRDHPNYPVKNDWSIFQQLKTNQNVSFKRTDVPLADWDKKKALLIGAGDTPEIVSVTYPGQETQFVSGGQLLPVSDYVQYMPNFEQKIKDWGLQEELDTHRQADGKYYILPGVREVPDVQYSVVVNDAMWQKAGITTDPATWDEFAQDLKKVKDANNLKYAMSDRWTDTTTLGAFLQTASAGFNTAAGWGYSNTWFNEDTKKFELTGISDNYKQLVTYAAGLVSSGVLDPEITQSDDQATQKFITGQSAAISGNTQEITSYRTKVKDAKGDMTMHMITIPDGPAGNYIAGGRLSSGLMVSADAAKDPHFKALLQYIDWQYYSDQGMEFAQWGVEGTTFAKASDGTRTLAKDVDWNGLNAGASKQLNADFGYSNGVFLLANGSSKDLLQSMMSPETKKWTNAVLSEKKVLPVQPAAQLNDDELEQTSLVDSQIKDAVYAATAKFITGQTPLSDWDKYVAQIKGLGADQLIDTYNTAYQRTQDK
ncbi:extracellular solute-binding protein [Luteimicrobium sp. DT211]|uniref:ABC transporter substrate-binding protein n=1 Tax=Luteimicrobium sp. DT211 TaxID=3393412 RepID=UPI003CF9487F